MEGFFKSKGTGAAGYPWGGDRWPWLSHILHNKPKDIMNLSGKCKNMNILEKIHKSSSDRSVMLSSYGFNLYFPNG